MDENSMRIRVIKLSKRTHVYLETTRKEYIFQSDRELIYCRKVFFSATNIVDNPL